MITGKCTCGNVSFRYNGECGPATYCHCEDCRRTTGSAFNVSCKLQMEDIEFCGERFIKKREYVADSGRPIVRSFCNNCGSPIYTFHPHEPGYLWIKAGIVDQTEMISPVHESWVSEKVAWAEIDVDASSSGNYGE